MERYHDNLSGVCGRREHASIYRTASAHNFSAVVGVHFNGPFTLCMYGTTGIMRRLDISIVRIVLDAALKTLESKIV